MSRLAVLSRLNAPLELWETDADTKPLLPRQIRVAIICTGICGAQLQELRGEKGNAKYLPHCLGHEACGRVLKVGCEVGHIATGDKVCLHWRSNGGIENPCSYLQGALGAGQIHTFGEQVIVSSSRATPVPEDMPDELVSLLGCALSTALCVMENVARVKRGGSIAIIGCGGVGLALIKAAKIAGAGQINVWDQQDKSDLALSLGATSWEGFRCHDVIIDTTGQNLGTALKYIAPSGRIVLVGQGEQTVTIGREMFAGEGISITATQAGGFQPSQDIPRFVQMWQSGLLSADGLVTHRYGLDQINEGIEMLKSGNAGRIMIHP